MYRRQSTFGKRLDAAGLSADVLAELTAIERAFNEIRQTQTPQIIQSLTGTTGGGGGSGSGGSITVQDHSGATFITNVTTLRVNTTYGLTLTNTGGGSAEINLSQNLTATGSPTFANLVVSTQLTIDTLSGVLKATAGVVSGSATTSDLPEGTNLYFTDERVDDRVADFLIGGEGIKLTEDDPGNTLTVALDFTEFDTDDITEGSTNWYASEAHVLSRYGTVMNEPTGFPSTAESDFTLSFDNSTRTLTVTRTGASYWFYIKGVKYTISATKTCPISDDEGVHFIYFGADSDLHESMTFPGLLLTEYALVCAVHWDATNNLYNLLMWETHGYLMPGAVQQWIHQVFGGRYISGFGLDNFTIGNASLDSHAQFSYDQGEFIDDDITHTYTASANPAVVKMFYKIGSDWRARKTPDAFALIQPSSTADYAGTTRIAYNLDTGGTWSLAECTNGSFVLTHLFATNDHDQKLIGILGENQYSTLAAARDGANTELAGLQLGGLPSTEWIPIATIIFQTGNTSGPAYSNSVRAKIVTNDLGTNWVDWRTATITASATTATDHGLLAGLSDDDHTQYMHTTTARTVTAVHIISNGMAFGTTYADAGYVRVPNTGTVAWRNAADSGNETLSVNASDQFVMTGPLIADAFIATGTAASVGAVRLVNNTNIAWRNAANSADVTLGLDNSDQFALGAGATIVYFTSPQMRLSPAVTEGTAYLYLLQSKATRVANDEVKIGLDLSANGDGEYVITHRQASSTDDDSSLKILAPDTDIIVTFYRDQTVIFGSTVAASAGIFGTTPAAAGAVRVPNNTAIGFRNAANGADKTLKLDGSDIFQFDAAVNISGALTLGTDLAIADGGTGAGTAAGARVNILPSLTGNAGEFLKVSAGEADVEWAAVAGGSPGGSDTHVQFNDGGSTFGGDSGFTYNKTTDVATLVGGIVISGTTGPQINLTAGSGSAYIALSQLYSAPAENADSAGMKLKFYDIAAAGYYDYSIGLEFGAMWFATAGGDSGFKWYSGSAASGGGATPVMSLTGLGVLTVKEIDLTTDLAIADGGTGASTAAAARVALLPALAGNAGEYLKVSAGETDVEWAAVTATATPAGSDAQLQYNNGGVLGGTSGFEWLDATGTLKYSVVAGPGMLFHTGSLIIDHVGGTTSTVTALYVKKAVSGDLIYWENTQANQVGMVGKIASTAAIAMIALKDSAGTDRFVVTAQGNLKVTGAGAGLLFQERDGAPDWQWYGTGGQARLFDGAGDVWTIDENGNQVNTGRLEIQGAIGATTGNIHLNHATSNYIYWRATGVGAPAFTTRTSGAKLVLWPAISGSAVDYAIGINSSNMWFSVPDNASTYSFYGATTEAARLHSTGYGGTLLGFQAGALPAAAPGGLISRVSTTDAAVLDHFSSTISNVITTYKRWVSSSFRSGSYTNATIITVPAATNSRFLLVKFRYCHNAYAGSTTTSGVIEIWGTFLRDASGTVTQIGSTTTVHSTTEASGPSVNFSISSTNILCRATAGSAGGSMGEVEVTEFDNS